MNADVRSIADLRKNICEILGLVEAVIPASDGAVLAYVPAQGNALAGDVEQGLNYVRSQHSSRVRLAPMQVTEDGLAANVVEKMLIDDVSMPTSLS